MANRRVTMNQSASVELISLFKHQLRMSRLRADELCLVVTDTAFNPVYADACMGAALDLGAEAYKIVLPFDSQLPHKSLGAAMREADLFFYSTTHTLHYSEEMRQGLAAGMRAVMAVQPLSVLARLKGDAEVARRSKVGAELLRAANHIRITSPAGTDLTMRREGRPVLANYGFSDEAGHLDFWGGGMVQTAPLEGTMEGRMVLDRGDLMFYIGRYVDQPVIVTFESGRVVAIEGGLDAFLLRKSLESYEEESAWMAGHIAWGTDRRAQWVAQAMQGPEPGSSAADAESYYGNVQIEIGSNNDVAFQGQNRSKAHLGHCMLNCSLFLDHQPVIRDGKFISPTLQ
jgi:2,5-dihydroxypyridine 5,6-dioxygenase